MGEYRVGQVCLNGHAITDSADEYPELQEEFCSKCGAATTMACHRCKVPIRGHYHIENVFGGPEYSPPHYCHKCGNPYPWTEARLKTARDLADGLDDLSVEERERLKVSLEELARNAPSTEAAAVRVKKLFLKLKGGSAEALRQVLIDVASETAKKVLGL